jgi:hypothetical protein
VNSVTGALIFVIPNVEFNRGRAANINSVDIIIRTDRLHHLLLEGALHTVRKADSGRKFMQRPLRPCGFSRPKTMRREDSSYEDERGDRGSHWSYGYTGAGF